MVIEGLALILVKAAVPVMSAFANRFRGGWLPTGHTELTRAIYSIIMAGLLYLVTDNWIFAGSSIPLWFVGTLAPNGAWMGMDKPYDFLYGTGSGLLNVALVCALGVYFVGFSVLWLLVAGASKGLAYYLGNKTPTIMIQFRKGPEFGELFFGFFLGLGLITLSHAS